MKSVFISILNFNGNNNTLDCVESLKRVNISDFKLTIMIIDNNSSEKLNLQKESLGKIQLEIIRNEKNLGFSGGHNVGIKHALKNGADYIVILNNDTYVHEDFLRELFVVAEKNDKIGILSPKIYFASGFEYHKNRYSKNEVGKVLWYAGGEMDWKNVIGHHMGVDEVDRGQFDKIENTELATGCCILLKKDVINKVGMFDDKYFLYYEDADLAMRTKKNGFEIGYVPKSIIWHKNAGSSEGPGSTLQDYYITRNRLVFGFCYAPIRSKLALFRESLSLLLRGRQWQKAGVIDFYLGRLGRGSYNV